MRALLAGRSRPDTVGVAELAEIRAALSAGAAPAAALSAADRGPLASVARQARLGRALSELAAEADTGDAAADLLVRALALAEQSGAGAGEAVEQALSALRDEADMARSLAVRTVQARGTVLILTAIPVLAWLLLVAADRALLRFYASAPGPAVGLAALALAASGLWWSRRIVAATVRAGAAADPLAARPARADLGRISVTALPAAAVGLAAAGPPAAAVLGAAAALAVHCAGRRSAARRGEREASPSGQQRSGAGAGAAEAVELVAIALASGLDPSSAITAVAPLAPRRARPAMAAAARRLRGGWTVQAAFDGSGLARLGQTLGVSERWGAPAAPALRMLAAELRADRRAASEAAAERAQLLLIFPTTLLTLPAFILAIVPPLLWTALAGAGGVGAD